MSERGRVYPGFPYFIPPPGCLCLEASTLTSRHSMPSTEDHDLVTIVVVDDDPDDRFMIQRALQACVQNPVHVLNDGEELMAYLNDRYAGRPQPSAPACIVLMDLNMPRKTGHEALREIRADPRLRTTPVIVLTTSDSETEIVRSYQLGANAYVTKPVSFSGFVQAMKGLNDFWLDIVRLPKA